MSLPDFTGVLAVVRPSNDYWFRAYVHGRRLNDWDCTTRKEAESELAEELERLVDIQNR